MVNAAQHWCPRATCLATAVLNPQQHLKVSTSFFSLSELYQLQIPVLYMLLPSEIATNHPHPPSPLSQLKPIPVPWQPTRQHYQCLPAPR